MPYFGRSDGILFNPPGRFAAAADCDTARIFSSTFASFSSFCLTACSFACSGVGSALAAVQREDQSKIRLTRL
jgi:hypothetical protein